MFSHIEPPIGIITRIVLNFATVCSKFKKSLLNFDFAIENVKTCIYNKYIKQDIAKQ